MPADRPRHALPQPEQAHEPEWADEGASAGVITIELPRALRPYARGSTVVSLDHPCATVGDALAALASQHPGVLDRVMDERGELRPHVNVFVDEESVRFLGGLDAPLAEGCTISIVPAVSGG